MTSSLGVEFADSILEDPTKAIPLLKLLHLFKTSRGDPLSEAEMDEVMHRVYTKIGHCHDSMMEFLEHDESNPIPRAA